MSVEELKDLPSNQLAAHFHDTFDNAIDNILCALEYGKSNKTQVVGQLIVRLEDWEVALTQ